VVNIHGALVSGNVAEVAIDPSNGNVQVSLNGFTIEYAAAKVRQINYVGGCGGQDTYTNRTSIVSVVTAYGGGNTFISGLGVTHWSLYGDGNSIHDDGGSTTSTNMAPLFWRPA
jgi:hypothetical protein